MSVIPKRYFDRIKKMVGWPTVNITIASVTKLDASHGKEIVKILNRELARQGKRLGV